MADELYDYFDGNASKKVEPIEDDDLDLDLPENDPGSDSKSEQQPSQQSDSPELTASEPKTSEVEPSEKTGEKKKSGHWDFLASVLGISSKSAPESEPEPKSTEPQPTEPPQTSESVSEPVAKEDDFFGFDPIPSPEDSTALPSMFAADQGEPESPTNDNPNADDLIGWNPAPTKKTEQPKDIDDLLSESQTPSPQQGETLPDDQPELDDAEDDDEFVEFEIEELDSSPLREDEPAAHGRTSRRRRSNENQDDDTRTSRGRKRGRGRDRHKRSDEDASQGEMTPESAGSNPRSRRDAYDQEEDRESRPSRRRRNSRGRKSNRGDQEVRDRQPADDFDSDDFGAGLEFEFDDPDSETPNIAPSVSDSSRDDQPRGQRKRRRRRRSRSRSEDSETQATDSSPVADDGFGAGLYDNEFESNLEPFESDSDGFDSEDDSFDAHQDSQRSERSGRRRGRSRRRRRKPESIENTAENQSPESDSAPKRKRVKVPTWEETIAGMIDSNIENHRKSNGGRRSGGGRSGGRGRRR